MSDATLGVRYSVDKFGFMLQLFFGWARVVYDFSGGSLNCSLGCKFELDIQFTATFMLIGSLRVTCNVYDDNTNRRAPYHHNHKGHGS